MVKCFKKGKSMQKTFNGTGKLEKLAQARRLSIGIQILSLTTGIGLVADDSVRTSEKKPNIVVILADDLGYGDVQCNNPQRGKIKTPNIDRLASEGVRFTDGHSSSGICSPSRYALLTGRYHWRTRLQRGIIGPWVEPLITPDRLTIAGLAKQQGYRTSCIGKWHLGWNWPISNEQKPLMRLQKSKVKDEVTPELLAVWKDVFSKPIKGGPTAVGFDTYFGVDMPNWPPYCFIENDRTVGIPSEYVNAKYLKESILGYQGPALKDWSLEAILPTLGERAVKFISESAKSNEPFLLYMPLTSPHTPIVPNKEWQGKSGLGNYADFVMETDAIVGLVLDGLEKAGIAKNTFVVFTSDNGCASYVGVDKLEESGHYPSGPLRGYKSHVWDGGHRIPFIIRWPDVVKPGSVCGQIVQQADFMATFAAIMGVKLPENVGEDSFNMLPLLKGVDKPVRELSINAGSTGAPAIRKGDWKLILSSGSGSGRGAEKGWLQLYNVAEDIGETKNLAKQFPERVEEIKKLYDKIVADGRSTPGVPQKNDVEVTIWPSTGTK